MLQVVFLGELLGPYMERLVQVDERVVQVEERDSLHGNPPYEGMSDPETPKHLLTDNCALTC
ncbi:hypothetical protein AB0M44_47115 [Streptosporangium subroseum]|uniref:hypothetical protein n=1 Tax=Streptosporangium subroseum TaxID=106412 RepID=UPI00341A6EB4